MTIKSVRAQSVEDYFNLPKKQRECFGIYRRPSSMLMGEWDKFEERILKEYPIQAYIREKVWGDYISPLGYKIKNIKYSIRNFIRPNHIRYRMSYLRHEYKEVDSIIEDGILALFRDFWYEECWPKTIVDWQGDEEHKRIYNWMKETIDSIESKIPALQKKLEQAYKNVSNPLYTNDNQSYNEKYKDVIRIEKEIEDLTTKILHEIIDNRHYLWT